MRRSRWLVGAVMVALFATFIAGVGCDPKDEALKQKTADLENKVTALAKQLEETHKQMKETHKQMERMAMEFQKRMEMGKKYIDDLAMRPRDERMPMDKQDRFGTPPQDGLQEPPRDPRLQKGMKENKRGFEPKEFDRRLRKPMDMEPGRGRDFEDDDEDGFRPPPPNEKRNFRPDKPNRGDTNRGGGDELDTLDELLLDDDFEEELERLLSEDDED